jgi:hypothetical protein
MCSLFCSCMYRFGNLSSLFWTHLKLLSTVFFQRLHHYNRYIYIYIYIPYHKYTLFPRYNAYIPAIIDNSTVVHERDCVLSLIVTVPTHIHRKTEYKGTQRREPEQNAPESSPTNPRPYPAEAFDDKQAPKLNHRTKAQQQTNQTPQAKQASSCPFPPPPRISTTKQPI